MRDYIKCHLLGQSFIVGQSENSYAFLLTFLEGTLSCPSLQVQTKFHTIWLLTSSKIACADHFVPVNRDARRSYPTQSPPYLDLYECLPHPTYDSKCREPYKHGKMGCIKWETLQMSPPGLIIMAGQSKQSLAALTVFTYLQFVHIHTLWEDAQVNWLVTCFLEEDLEPKIVNPLWELEKCTVRIVSHWPTVMISFLLQRVYLCRFLGQNRGELNSAH